MMKFFLLCSAFLLVLVVPSKSISIPLCRTDVVCFDLWDPVCGSDGKTYGNSCELGAASCGKVTLAHKGACSGVIEPLEGVVSPCRTDVMCIDLYDPVCGSDGKTYGNSCELGATSCGKVTLAYKGECGSGVIQSLES